MPHSLSVHDPILTEARSRLMSGDTATARSILMDLIRRDPECNEAIQLLLLVDQAQHRRRMAKLDEGNDSVLSIGVLSRESAYEIKAVLMGGFFFVAGLWCLYWFFKVGLYGEVPREYAPFRVVHLGRDALVCGLAASIIGAASFVYGLRQLRLK